jgi:hypothetical protein
MADKKRDILEFVEQWNFEQMIPTRLIQLQTDFFFRRIPGSWWLQKQKEEIIHFFNPKV